MRLNNKVAVITGGANGMGAEEARLFAAEGAKVAIGDIDYDGATQLAREINDGGGSAIAVRHDVTSEEDWRSVLPSVAEHFGSPVTVLVNNAGINGERAAFENTSLELWNRIMKTNGSSVFLGIREAGPHMRDAGGGSIINISSVLGLRGAIYPTRDGAPSPGYGASKAAVAVMTKMAAAQFGGWKVRVNSLHPGLIKTSLNADTFADPQRMAYFMSSIPLKEPGEPADVANTALFLASDESKFINGAEFVIDGGYLARA